MSIANLFVDNEYDLFCNSLTADILTIGTLSVTDLTVTNDAAINGDLNMMGTSTISIQGGTVDVLTGSIIGGNITLTTTGGTPTALDYYEEVEVTIPFGGAFNTPINIPIDITRIGNLVHLRFPAFPPTVADNNALILSTSSLPARFRPETDYKTYIDIQVAATPGLGAIQFGSDGSISVGVVAAVNNTALGNFTAASIAAWTFENNYTYRTDA